MLSPLAISSLVLALLTTASALPEPTGGTTIPPTGPKPKDGACDTSVKFFNKECGKHSVCIPDPALAQVPCTLQFPPGPCFNGMCVPLVVRMDSRNSPPRFVRCGGFSPTPNPCPIEKNQVCVEGVNPCIPDLPGYCAWNTKPEDGPVKEDCPQHNKGQN